MIELFELIRKIEVLFLPLFPKKWLNPPPSYRLIIPLLQKLGRYDKRFHWVNPLLDSIHTQIYPPYHEGTLITGGMTRDEMTWMRFILLVVVFILLMGITAKAQIFSPWIKGSLLLGSTVLFIHGSIALSISALWASWGFLFPLVVALGIGVAPWVMSFLAFWVVLLHMPVLKGKRSWTWYEGLCTFPILFFWVGTVGKMLAGWPLWQIGLLSVGLWLLVWIILVRMEDHPWISKSFQLFWPVSLLTVTLIISVQPKVYGLVRWSLWVLLTIGISLGLSKSAFRISRWPFLFRWPTTAAAFSIFALILLLKGDLHLIKETIDTALLHFFYSLDLVWWIIGAGIIASLRGLTMMFLKWLQALFHIRILPFLFWALPLLAYDMGWLSPLIAEVGIKSAAGLCLLFTIGATSLTWLRKENILREWIFWGFYFFLLTHQYWSDIHQTVDLYWSKSVVDTKSYVILAIWLLWLNYYSVGKYLARFREKIHGAGAVAFMGGMLWLLVAFLWMSHVDQQLSLRGRIDYHLLRGFTFLGLPLIAYHLIVQKYLEKESERNMPWGLILILGIGFVQIMQGIEHTVTAWVENQSLDALQKQLHQILLSGVPLEEVVPSRVTQTIWVLVWRIVRWIGVMSGLTLVMHFHERGRLQPAIWIMTACFTSLAVWTAEATWLFWPSMPLEWAVILRPWVQTTLVWDGYSFTLYLLYFSSGLIWGWLFLRFIKRYPSVSGLVGSG